MLKEDVLKKLTDCGLVAVVRANNAEEAIKISDACLAGGCTGIELTFGFIAETAKLCNRYRVPYMPGCATITEVITAMEAGADIIKIFPADLYGPTIIKDIKGPLPQAQMMPTGGVDKNNVAEWS